jgi:folate-binding protein YgfZ
VADVADAPDLRASLGAAPIQRDVVRARGPEALDYLQGQLSQDVAALGEGESRPSFLLQPTGKVDAWLRVTRLADDDLLLDVDQGHGEAVLARLQRFRLRTKVDLEVDRWSGLALRGPGAGAVEAPAGALALTAAWQGVEALDLLASGELALAGVPLVSADALEALRIECGIPAMGAELTTSTIPGEAGRWLVDVSVSFTKGCYTGQELVARVDSRGGNVPRPIRGLVVAGVVPPAGAAVLAEGAEVGTVTSAARSPALGSVALAIVGRATEPGARVEVRWDGGDAPAEVRELPLR